MSLQRISYQDRESWLEGRAAQGIGASEAASICGFSHWVSSTELWQIKTGQKARKDISSKDYVERGHTMEEAIRDFFTATHPQYTLEYHPFDLLFQSERPWLFATLDGELMQPGWEPAPENAKIARISSEGTAEVQPYTGKIPTLRRGILEIKTATPNGKSGWEEWNGKIPDQYYAQILHQLAATGYDFAILFAALYGRDGDITLREYAFERSEKEADILWLLQKETSFWLCVETGTIPALSVHF